MLLFTNPTQLRIYSFVPLQKHPLFHQPLHAIIFTRTMNSHSEIISFWIRGEVNFAFFGACFKWSFRSLSNSDFQFKKKMKFPFSSPVFLTQLPLEGAPRIANLMMTSMMDNNPFFVRICCSDFCLDSLATISLPG